jgi:hypothetical protein
MPTLRRADVFHGQGSQHAGVWGSRSPRKPDRNGKDAIPAVLYISMAEGLEGQGRRGGARGQRGPRERPPQLHEEGAEQA